MKTKVKRREGGEEELKRGKEEKKTKEEGEEKGESDKRESNCIPREVGCEQSNLRVFYSNKIYSLNRIPLCKI